MTRLDVLPHKVAFSFVGQKHRFVVEGVCPDGLRVDLSEQARFVSSNSDVAAVENSAVARVTGKGYAKLTASYGVHRADAELLAWDQGQEQGVRFERDVAPILTLGGCNNHTCHGSLHGKNGFRLSLFGYDARSDYRAMARGGGGRRVNLTDPQNSLLLLKPTLQVAHGGGLRFARASHEYQVLLEWIAGGAQAPQASEEGSGKRLDVAPAEVILTGPGSRHRLSVLARFQDGMVEEATSRVRYSSQDESVATVSAGGVIESRGPGDTVILVRTSGALGSVRVSVLRPGKVPPVSPAVSASVIDRLVFQRLSRLRLEPSAPCSDETFIRRVFLDILGLLPTTSDLREFLANEDRDKRAKLVDRLLTRPEYADYWGMLWADWFTVTARKTGGVGTLQMDEWIRAQLRRNVPLDEWARSMIGPVGSMRENPGLGFVRSRPPEELAGFYSQLFLGVRIQCAQCHNHPFERWTQSDFFSFAAFFGQVSSKAGRNGIYVFDDPSKELSSPLTGRPAEPRFLGGSKLHLEPGTNRRRLLATWMTAPDNPFFARTSVNRIWKQMMGAGLVEPVDDLRETNPASDPELLDALARDFIAHGYDLKHLLRTIATSRAYQLSSTPTESNRHDQRHYSRFYPRRLLAESLLDAIEQVTGARRPLRFGYPGMRAVERYDVLASPSFLRVFHQSSRDRTCQREETPNLLQTIELANGDILNERVHDMQPPSGDAAGQVEEVFLRALARRPTAKETSAAAAALKTSADRQKGLEDVVWALLNSREFSYNH